MGTGSETAGTDAANVSTSDPRTFSRGNRGSGDSRHAYNVLQVFEYGGETWMQMRNPMGMDGGAINSGNTRDGIVYVTWEEFQHSMTYLAAF